MANASSAAAHPAGTLPCYFPETLCRYAQQLAGTCQLAFVAGSTKRSADAANTQVGCDKQAVGRVGLEPTTEGL
jgi:hypothetical protein